MAEYITKLEVEQYLGITIDATLQTFMDTIIAMTQEYIEAFCGGGIIEKRVFNDADTTVTRYYDGKGLTRLKIDDLRSITSLSVDGVALTKDDDYYLYPLNAVTDGIPYESIELLQPETRLGANVNSRLEVTSPYTFLGNQRNVTIVGKWGYSLTPPKSVKLAALRLVGQVIKENIGDNDLKSISSESLGDHSVSYSEIKDSAITSKIGDILEPYVRKSNNKKTGVFLVR